MKRRGWPGALYVTVMAAAVMLVWTAWVFHVVALPGAPGDRAPVFQTIEDRGCLRPVPQDV
jgi:hypothetical protein